MWSHFYTRRRRREPFSTRAFRALLALYPASFRDEYGRELTLVFVDRYRTAASGWERARLWGEALIGILADSPREHHRMILQDLQYASRMLRQHMLLTVTIVITLALGIGANTAVFSVLNAVTLSTLPVREADQLFTVNTRGRLGGGPESARLSGVMFDRLRDAAPDGVTVAAMSRGVARVFTRTIDSPETTLANLQLVSSNYFPVLGVTPTLGRTATGDEEAGAAPVAMISYSYWQRRFAGAQDVIGKPLTINGTAFTIIGVGPRDFAGVWLELPVDIWTPLTTQQAVKYSQDFSADGVDPKRPWMQQPNIWWLYVVARAPVAQVAAVTGAFESALADLPGGGDNAVALAPFASGFSKFRQQFSRPLLALTVLAALVLLIACANVANLLLAHALARQREIAVRMALGAGRLRLFHQLLTESVLLVLMAGIAAIFVAGWAGNLLVRMATASTDGLMPFTAPIDGRVLAFTAGVAFVTVLLFGVMPAWRATRLDVNGALKASPRGAIGGRVNPARVLVVAQVALSFVLVVAAGLFVQSFRNLLSIDLGFDREGLVSIAIDTRLSATPPQHMAALQQRVLDEVRAVPGVRSASLAMCGIQSNCRAREDYRVEGYQPRPGERVQFVVNAVSPSYFSTVGMRMLAGRVFTDRDSSPSTTVALVNKTLASTYFQDGQAIGKRFGYNQPNIEIVGIVEDARVLNVKDAAMPTVYFLLTPPRVLARSLDVRTSGDPRLAIAAIRRAVVAAAPDLPIEGAVTMEERVRRNLSQDRLVMLLTSAFGALALGLAGFGLFGLLSYAVVRRTPEFGLRMALGAPRSRVLRGVVREALWLVLCGVLLGVPVAILAGVLASTLVFGVSPHDGLSLMAAVLVLVTVGFASSLLPALRASRVDPMVALRQE
jgi:putative ABC transport system permease protein